METMQEIINNVNEAVKDGVEKARQANTVAPVVRLVDIRVVADPPANVLRGYRTLEDQANALESWANELQDFVRDHRSQDPVYLSVERETARVCSGCGEPWEECPPDEYSDTPYCASCGADVTQSDRDAQTSTTPSRMAAR